MGLMALGTMFAIGTRLIDCQTPPVRCHTLSLVEDLDGGWGRADLDLFLHQRVGHAIEVLVEHAVIVDVDPRFAPLAQLIRRSRQRLQGGACRTPRTDWPGCPIVS